MDDRASSPSPPVAEWQRCGLYDPDAPNAADRLALLEYLVDRGATLESMLEAERIGNLSGLVAELTVAAGRSRIDARELAERARLPLDAVFRLGRAAGLPHTDPDERVHLESDVAAFEVFAVGVELFGEDSAIQFGRVIGAAEELDAIALGQAMTDFERAAAETISSGEGRLVKTIGDEVIDAVTLHVLARA